MLKTNEQNSLVYNIFSKQYYNNFSPLVLQYLKPAQAGLVLFVQTLFQIKKN